MEDALPPRFTIRIALACIIVFALCQVLRPRRSPVRPFAIAPIVPRWW